MEFLWWCLLVRLSVCSSSGANPNPDITNGTCYYKPGEKLDEAFSPAGNAALGHTFCCELGDKLNSHSVCVKEDIVYTYLAGCTDPMYENPNCPYKGNYSDYPWVGMVQCKGVDAWVGCDNDKSQTVRKSSKSEECTCELGGDNADEVLVEAAGLDAWGFLPDEPGKSIEWLPGFPLSTTPWLSGTGMLSSIIDSSIVTLPTPTSRPLDSTKFASASRTWDASSSQATTDSLDSGSSTPNDATKSGIDAWSTSQKVGLGFGIGLAGLVFMALMALLVKKMYDRSVARPTALTPSFSHEKTPIQTGPTMLVIQDHSLRSPAWPVHKSELPGSPLSLADANPSPVKHESMTTSSSCSSPLSPLSKHSSETSPYRPFRYRPSTDLEGIQELPDHERPRWAQTNFGTYSPILGAQAQQERTSMQDQHYSDNSAAQKGIYELPG